MGLDDVANEFLDHGIERHARVDLLLHWASRGYDNRLPRSPFASAIGSESEVPAQPRTASVEIVDKGDANKR